MSLLVVRAPLGSVRIEVAEPGLAASFERLWLPALGGGGAPLRNYRLDASGEAWSDDRRLEFEGSLLERAAALQAHILADFVELHGSGSDSNSPPNNTLLHAAGFVLAGRLFVLVGDSGAGKSSFSREALRRGAEYLSDDVLMVGAGQMHGMARTVQFDGCERSAVPEHFRDCELVPWARPRSWGLPPLDDFVIPIWPGPHATRESFSLGEGAVVVRLRHCSTCEVAAVNELSSLERLAELHGASFSVGRDYDGSLGYGPTFEVAWTEPSASWDELLRRLA
ncbi:MAG TPA: hypothetical protein VLC09_06720 [Polyangiaceae bacterium]|nr:hypothetical protein [Polyangiaceae bacterium]